MKNTIRVKNREKATTGSLISKDTKFRIYTIVLVSSVALMVFSLVFPGTTVGPNTYPLLINDKMSGGSYENFYIPFEISHNSYYNVSYSMTNQTTMLYKVVLITNSPSGGNKDVGIGSGNVTGTGTVSYHNLNSTEDVAFHLELFASQNSTDTIGLYITSAITPNTVNIQFFAPSLFMSAIFAFAVAHRIRVLNTGIQEPGSIGDESFYTISPDWSGMRTWPPFILGFGLIALSYAIGVSFPKWPFTGVIAILGVLCIGLGFLLIYLKFLSR